MRERGRCISPTGKGQVHEEKSSKTIPNDPIHPPTHSPIQGVESTPKTGVEYEVAQKVALCAPYALTLPPDLLKGNSPCSDLNLTLSRG